MRYLILFAFVALFALTAGLTQAGLPATPAAGCACGTACDCCGCCQGGVCVCDVCTCCQGAATCCVPGAACCAEGAACCAAK